jgi:hypothetical protein
MTLFFPDLFALAKTSHGLLSYGAIAAERQKEVDEKFETFSVGAATLYHRAEEWDSRIFGLRVGKIEYVMGENREDISACVKSFFSGSPYDYVVIRISQSFHSWIQELERAGAIFLDTTVEMSCEISKKFSAKKVDPHVFLAAPSDKDSILNLANSFQLGRFFTDPEFMLGQIIYKEWLENSLSGKAADQTYVYKDEAGLVHGVVTAKEDVMENRKVLKIPLVVKSSASKLSGVSLAMLSHVLNQAAKEKFDVSEISTQGTNISAQRAYIAAGYRPFHTGITMRWKR